MNHQRVNDTSPELVPLLHLGCSKVATSSRSPSEKGGMDHQSFLLPAPCLCQRSLPPSWHNSQPGKRAPQDAFPKKRTSQLLDAAGPLRADVARRGALARPFVLWGTRQAVHIKSRPAWKAFKQKWNMLLWQGAQWKISACQLCLLSPLSWSLFFLHFWLKHFLGLQLH